MRMLHLESKVDGQLKIFLVSLAAPCWRIETTLQVELQTMPRGKGELRLVSSRETLLGA
jgi:hypothetical protein